jgi:AraC-like DNA-binding protein
MPQMDFQYGAAAVVAVPVSVPAWIADDAEVGPDGASRVPYGAIDRYVRANLSRRIAVHELAGLARLSVFQLFRAFRRDRATTPCRFVLELRIEHAKQRLRAGASIAETAFQTGFADQSHLTRQFKRLTGLTPKAYCAQYGCNPPA